MERHCSWFLFKNSLCIWFFNDEYNICNWPCRYYRTRFIFSSRFCLGNGICTDAYRRNSTFTNTCISRLDSWEEDARPAETVAWPSHPTFDVWRLLHWIWLGCLWCCCSSICNSRRCSASCRVDLCIFWNRNSYRWAAGWFGFKKVATTSGFATSLCIVVNRLHSCRLHISRLDHGTCWCFYWIFWWRGSGFLLWSSWSSKT